MNATLKRHIEGYFDSHPEVCSRLTSSLYADDVNTGGYTEAEVIELYTISKQIMKDGGFNLRKWLSNSKEVMSEINAREVKGEIKPPVYMSITEDDQSFAKTSLKQTEAVDTEGTKVLGLIYDTETDTFIFNFENLTAKTREAPDTNRTILGMIAKIYDPLGWITPLTSPLRIFLQKLFQANIQWDETLLGDLAKEWNSLLSQIECTQRIIIPRHYFGKVTAKSLEIPQSKIRNSEVSSKELTQNRNVKSEKQHICHTIQPFARIKLLPKFVWSLMHRQRIDWVLLLDDLAEEWSSLLSLIECTNYSKALFWKGYRQTARDRVIWLL